MVINKEAPIPRSIDPLYAALLAAVVLSVMVGCGYVATIATSLDPARERAYTEQLRTEKAEFRTDSRALTRQIAKDSAVAVQPIPAHKQRALPQFPTKPANALVSLKRHRYLWKITLDNKRARLAAVRMAVPDVPRWFVHQALRVARCESGLDWTYNGSSGFDGALQFHPNTWTRAVSAWYGKPAPAFAYLASPAQQIEVAYAWWRAIGGVWAQTAGWPVCGRLA